MKKILLLTALVSFTFMNAQIWSDDFNDNDVSDWTLVDNDGDGHQWMLTEIEDGNYKMLSQSYDNTDGAYTPDNWFISPAIDLTGQTTVILNWQVMSLLKDWDTENYTVYVAAGDTVADFTAATAITFNESTLDGVNSLTYRNLDISALAGETNVHIAFRHHDVTDMFQMSIDNVSVATEIYVVPSAPNAATLLTPTDAATDVAIDTTDYDDDGSPDMIVSFDWVPATTGEETTSYEFYLAGTLDDLATIAPLTEVSFSRISIINTTYDTTYYWKVVAKNEAGSATASPAWSFTTESDPNAAALEDNTLESSISIYPNVTSENFTIKNTSDIAVTTISLFDINGRIVLTQDLNNLVGEKTINVSNLNTGMYFVEISSTNAKITRKLIKK